MRVYCVDRRFSGVSYGKWYNVIHNYRDAYFIQNDIGMILPYSQRCFVTNDQLRLIKLISIKS